MNKFNKYFLIITILANCYFSYAFELHYDEAYYWVWSQHLGLSYYDHPPLIAYLIHLATAIYKSEFTTRLPSIILTTITVIIIYKLSKKAFGKQVANVAVTLCLSMPTVQGMIFIASPDSALMTFWILTMYLLYNGIFESDNKSIYYTGISMGLAMLSKYTAALIYPITFIFLIITQYRKQLLHKPIYIAFLISVLIFMPVIIWNYQHNFTSILFQWNHAINIKSITTEHILNYIIGQFAVLNPVIFCAMIFYTIRYIKINLLDEKLKFFALHIICGAVLFGYLSIYEHVEANWSAPMYISGIPLIAYHIRHQKLIPILSVIFIIIATLILKLPLTFMPNALHNKVYVLNKLFLNKELSDKVKPYTNSNTVIIACDYANASRLWFYLDRPIYVLPDAKFANQYKYFDAIPRSNNIIYVCDNEDGPALAILKQKYTYVKILNVISASNRITDKYLIVYKVE